jgi:hypothetical protein
LEGLAAQTNQSPPLSAGLLARLTDDNVPENLTSPKKEKKKRNQVREEKILKSMITYELYQLHKTLKMILGRRLQYSKYIH